MLRCWLADDAELERDVDDAEGDDDEEADRNFVVAEGEGDSSEEGDDTENSSEEDGDGKRGEITEALDVSSTRMTTRSLARRRSSGGGGGDRGNGGGGGGGCGGATSSASLRFSASASSDSVSSAPSSSSSSSSSWRGKRKAGFATTAGASKRAATDHRSRAQLARKRQGTAQKSATKGKQVQGIPSAAATRSTKEMSAPLPG